MLKITPVAEEGKTTVELEGKLAGPWVEELERFWSGMAGPARMSLKAVTFVDDKGKELLKKMHERGVELIAQGCMTKAIVEDICRRAERTREKERSSHGPLERT
ncbi:MAG TPA: hypothetical protein VNL14_15045 [Candidatus Acidoferrales bacterium]|nr:hypothetical protein [Candidatus Acidoferrales bacterium]